MCVCAVCGQKVASLKVAVVVVAVATVFLSRNEKLLEYIDQIKSMQHQLQERERTESKLVE